MEGGGGGDQDHGFVPSFLKKIVGVAQQLPGVALALHIGVGGQGVNIPHGDLCPVGKLDGAGEHGRHGVHLSIVIDHQDLVNGAELLEKDIHISAGISKALSPEISQLGQFFRGSGADGDHGGVLLCFRSAAGGRPRESGSAALHRAEIDL